MAAQSKTTEQYSTLEWIRDDVTISAPELDHAIAAPELDSAVLAPQTVFHTGPEVAYDDSPPEALDRSEDDNENQTSSTVLKPRRLSKRIVIITLVCIAVAAAAIGVGIYFGRRTEAHTSSSKEFNITSPGPNATFPPSSAPLAKHGILNDSSLAALSLPNGDRRLFYQDYNGQIKQAAYSSSSREWPSTLISVVASDARNNTPLAAINLVSSGDPLALVIYLFYVSTNGRLAIAWFARGAWTPIAQKSGISQFVAGTDSRSLSATQIPDPHLARTILIYQNSGGLMMIMECISSPGLESGCSWQDLTSKLHSSIPSIRPKSRFSSLYYNGYLAILFYDNESNTQIFVVYSNGSFFDYTWDISSISSPIPSSERVFASAQSMDGHSQLEIISIDETRLVCPYCKILGLPDSPASSFSSSRLAAASGNSSTFYVYHQINDDTFGEDQGEVSTGGWIQSNITVPAP